MTFGAEVWGPALIGAAGSIGGGLLSGLGSGKETKMQKTQRKLVDQLISSLGGQGPYSDLYNADESTFQKSFVEPAQSLFRNQIAPQIQQQYIASGQQRGTGLDDQLLRAGVDLDSLLNQHMSQFQQGALNRKENAINSILGSGSGGTQNMGTGQSLMQSAAGYLSSPAFSDTVSNLFKQPQQQQSNSTNPYAPPPRRGFAPEWSDWKLGDPRWGS
jgi:hypothetical protein